MVIDFYVTLEGCVVSVVFFFVESRSSGYMKNRFSSNYLI